MLFSDLETYTISEVQNGLGCRSRPEAEAELQKYAVVGMSLGGTTIYHGAALNAMILRESTTHEDRGETVERRSQKRSKGGKFAPSFCKTCGEKMSRGKCPKCD